MNVNTKGAVEVNVQGASQITGVPVGTLRFWRSTNQGPQSYLVGGKLRYDVADLRAWLREQKAQSVRGDMVAVSA
jgi:DNA-binding transcriptional MerR regulator